MYRLGRGCQVRVVWDRGPEGEGKISTFTIISTTKMAVKM